MNIYLINIGMTKNQLLQRLIEDLEELDHAIRHNETEELQIERMNLQGRIQQLEFELYENQSR
jgi:hypothetical protein